MSPQEKLLDWFLQNQRQLTFRKSKDPYKIWVSEVMLQQTRVTAMLPSFDRFIQELPTITDLACAKEEDVIRLWRGLGYYSRALNLRNGAIYITENHDGKFPKTLVETLKIPGIGPYTANAILSIAFDLPLAVLDGNVKRVLSRYFLFEKDIGKPSSHKELQELANIFLNQKSSGDHNQALMELGATICGIDPKCLLCSIGETCQARLQGKTKELPVTSKDKKKLEIEIIFLIFEKDEKIYLEKNSKRRFFKTIFTPPFIILGKNLSKEYENNYSNEFVQYVIDNKIQTGKKHSITHHSIYLNVMRLQDEKLFPISSNQSKWISKINFEKEFSSSIAKKIFKFI